MALIPHSKIERWLRCLSLAVMACAATAINLRAAPAEPADTAAQKESLTITRFQQWWDLPEEQRSKRYPYRFELRVLYSDPTWRVLIVSDGFIDTFVHMATASPRILSGQRLIIEGEVVPREGLRLDQAKVTVLAEPVFPEPLNTDGRISEIGTFNCRYVQVNGYVNRQSEIDANHVQLDLIVEGRPVMVQLMIEDSRPIPQVEGAFVQLTGAYSGAADKASAAPRFELWVPSERHLTVTGWLSHDPRFTQPATAVDQIVRLPANQVVLVRGRVHSRMDGDHLVLRDDTGQVTIRTAERMPLELGTQVEAIGLPAVHGAVIELREALFRRAATADGPAARPTGLPLLRLADQVRDLTRESAEVGYPVRLQGVVVWSHPQSRTFYLQDASGGLAMELGGQTGAVPDVGLRVEVRGRSAPGEFAPFVRAESVLPGDRVALPEARSVTLEHAMTGVEEGQLISLTGYVRHVGRKEPWTQLELTTSAGDFSAVLPPSARDADLLGTVVRVRGVCKAQTGSEHELSAVQLWVADPGSIEVEDRRPADPFAVPVRTIAGLRQFSTLNALNRRVRVSGVVLDHAPGEAVALADGTQSLLVLSEDTTLLVPGDRIEAVGLPGRQRDRVVLREAVYRKVGHGNEPDAVLVDERDPISPQLEGRLVQVHAKLLDLSERQDALRLICQSSGVVFEAPLRRVPRDERRWERGSTVALTGVYRLQYDDYGRPRGVELQLRSAADVKVLRRAPWLTTDRAAMIGGGLVAIVLAGLLWVNSLQHRVRRQTEQIRMQLEKASQLEAELVRSSRLESLGVLAGGIAHDFNNLLTVVMGNVSLVLTEGTLDVEARGFLRESERAARRARDLTQQLLTFSRGGAPVRTAVALPEIVREAAAFAAHGSAVRCDFAFSPELWPADADRGQIAQVVHNLVINAIQAMPHGGVVRIAVDNEHLAAGAKPGLAAGSYVRLRVTDTGAGIKPEHLTRIFDPYFSTKEHGHGLGLATVYSIVKKHGGHVEVSSAVGEGSTFQLWLAAAAVRPSPEGASPAPAAKPWRGRVLVMDDEETIRNFLRVSLERAGCEVRAVADGAAAVQEYDAARAAGRPYELVILDLTIPAGMGGAEAMDRLRALDPKVRAIVSSGYSKDPVMARYREYGFAGCVPKPYAVPDLLNTIAVVMQESVSAHLV